MIPCSGAVVTAQCNSAPLTPGPRASGLSRGESAEERSGMTTTVFAPLRVALFGYDPSDVEDLLSASRSRLARLSDRVDRDESALVVLVDEVRRCRARADEAEASRVEFERALGLARSTAAALVAEAETLADQVVLRARSEAEDLVTRARVEARRAGAAERREARSRLVAVEAEEARLAELAGALDAERARLRETEERWRRETAWLAAQMLRAVAPRPAALPAAGDTGQEDDVLDLREDFPEDPIADRVFARFMSDDIEDDPSRQWVMSRWATGDD